MLNQLEAARLLGMKTTEIVAVDAYGADTVVRLHDGSAARVPEHAATAAEVDWTFAPPITAADPAAAGLRSELEEIRRTAFVPPAEWRAQLREASADGADVDELIALIASWGPAGTSDAPAEDYADEESADPVPDGSADAVLAWVGGDPVRASRAREAEQGRDRPRSTLLAQLDKVTEDGA